MPGDPPQAPAAQQVVEFARTLTLDGIPAEVVIAAKAHFLDGIGVGLAAASLGGSGQLAQAIARLGAGTDSTGFGLPEPLPAASAALLNGTLIHSLEYDDTHIASVVHGSSVLVPAVLAVAEREGASGAEMLRAYIAGWEFFVRLGLAAPGRFQARGFQITSVGGPLVAALVAAMLAELDVAPTLAALGIAGSQSSGIFEYLSEGATVKSLHPGWAAHGGLIAAQLAQGGMTGPSSVLDGRFGIYRTFADDAGAAERFRALASDLGSAWHLPSVALKLYPCCHYIHPFLECLDELTNDGLEPAGIAAMVCLVPPEEAPIICDPWTRKQRPTSGYEAKFSLPYCLAAQLIDGKVDVETFAADPRAEAVELCQRISWRPRTGTGFPDRYAGRIEVRMVDGTVREASLDDVRGGPARLLTASEVAAKFDANAARRLSAEAIERLRACVGSLEDAADMGELSAALRDTKPG